METSVANMDIDQTVVNPDLEESIGAAIDEFISMADTEKVSENGKDEAKPENDVVTEIGNNGPSLTSSPLRVCRKERPSAMEILQAVSTEATKAQIVSENGTEDKTREADGGRLEFRVATPNLSRLIDENGSDSDGPDGSVMLSDTLAPRSNTNSPFVSATPADSTLDSSDLGLGPLEQNPLLTALDSTKVEDIVNGADGDGLVENGAGDQEVPGAFVAVSPQKARRGKGRRGGSRSSLKVKMFSTRQNPLPSGSEVLDPPLEGDSVESATMNVPVEGSMRPVTERRGRGRGGRRGRGQRSKWTRIKGQKRPRSDQCEEEPDEPVYEGVSVSAPTSPDFSPPKLGKESRTSSPPRLDAISSLTPPPLEGEFSLTPPPPLVHDESSRTSILSDESGRMVDVERRIEEIQTLVSNMQRQISASVVPSTQDTKTSSDDTSPSKSSKQKLKMKIRLGEGRKRGMKRQRRQSYGKDDEYQPGPKKKFDASAPTRHSVRKSDHDLFLDRMKYLGAYSDDSRSPSPQRTVYDDPEPSTSGYIPDPGLKLNLGSKILLSKCKTFNIHLFDFVKCFNIKDLDQLDDLNFNKDIRRQIRALEKGHQIARMKSKVLQFNANANAADASNKTLEPRSLVPGEGVFDGLNSADVAATNVVAHSLSDQLDFIFDDVLHGKKRRKKKRHRSGHSSKSDSSAVAETGPAPIVAKPTSATKKQFRCKECTFITADLPCIQEHIHMHQEPFQCSECKTIFSQYSVALEHTITKHANSPARVIKSPNFNPNDHFDEVIMDDLGTVLEEHPRNVNDSLPRRPSEDREMNYQCQLCAYRTDDRQEIESHLQNNHRTEYQYICRICDLAFCKKRETMLKHFKKWHAGLPLDFTTAPGVEDLSEGASTGQGTGDQGVSGQESPSRPPSVISIASETSPKDTAEKRTITSGADNDVELEMEETPQKTPSSEPSNNTSTPSVLGVENRPCTYKCLQCGAKTDAFDVICAHLEVSHPDTEYSFACPFCDDYKAKTCSFVAEHIRTAHSENSKRCMERKLENAHLYVSREFVEKGPEDPTPPRSDSTRSSNQENHSPDDEVMIVDVGSSDTRRPLQPLSVVHHQIPVQAPPELVQVGPGFSVPKTVYDSYQVFNLKPPVVNHVNPAPPRNPLQQRSQVPQQSRQAPSQPLRSVGMPSQMPRAPVSMQRPAVRPMTQQPPHRPVLRAPRPTGRFMNPIQPRPMNGTTMPQPSHYPRFYPPTSQPMMANPTTSMQYPVLMQEILNNAGGTAPGQMYNGPVSNHSR